MHYAIALAPVIGVTLHNLNAVVRNQFTPVFGLVIGMFFYITIRDLIPSGAEGKPLEYFLGTFTYLSIIIAANIQ